MKNRTTGRMLFVTVVAKQFCLCEQTEPKYDMIVICHVGVETHRKGSYKFSKLAERMKAFKKPWTVYAFNEFTKTGMAHDQFRRPPKYPQVVQYFEDGTSVVFPRKVCISSLLETLK